MQRWFTESVTKRTGSPQEPKKSQHQLLYKHNLKKSDIELI